MTSSRSHISEKASRFTESVIREMTRLAMQHDAINLAQGFPDFAAPEEVKRAAMEAIEGDVNQYAITWGAKEFRDAIARKTQWYLGLEIDPEPSGPRATELLLEWENTRVRVPIRR